MKSKFLIVVAAAGLVVTGCKEEAAKPVVTALDAAMVTSSDDVGLDAGPDLQIDAGKPRSVLRYNLVATLVDGGIEVVELHAEAPSFRAEVGVVRSLTVTTVALRDYRIRVIADGSDQVVPSDDTATEADGGLSYSIVFSAPLKAGRTYAVTFEAQTGAQLTDVSGKPWDDVRVMLKVGGEIEAEPGKSAKKKKKKR